MTAARRPALPSRRSPRWRPPSPPGCGSRATTAASSGCRARRSSAAGTPAATRWALAAAALFAAARRGSRRGCSRCSPRPRSPPPLFALTLALRLALGAASRGPREWSRVFDARRLRGRRTSTCRRSRRSQLRPAASSSTASPSSCPRCPVHAAGHPPGLLLRHARARRSTPPARLAALCIGAGALSRAARLRARRARCSTSARARIAGAARPRSRRALLLFGATSADAVYATAGMLAAWPLAVAGRGARALGRRCCSPSPRCFAWSLLAVGAWAALLAWRRDGLRATRSCSRRSARRALVAFHGALAARDRLRPDRHAARDRGGLPLRDRRPSGRTGSGCPGSPVGVPAHARAAGRLAARCARSRAARGHRDRDLRRARDRGGRRVHEGRGRADLAASFAPLVCLAAATGCARATCARCSRCSRSRRSPGSCCGTPSGDSRRGAAVLDHVDAQRVVEERRAGHRPALPLVERAAPAPARPG